MIVGIIPARGGSKGLPGKNIADLCGKPVMGYTIEAARESRLLDHLFITTDDDAIADVGKRYNVDVIRRPPELAADKTPMPDTIRHAVNQIELQGKKVSIVVWMQANVPIRVPGMIDQVLTRLQESDAESAQTVVSSHFPPSRASKLVEGSLVPYFGQYPSGSNRQDFATGYFPDGAVVAVRRDCLFRKGEGPTHVHSHWGRKSLGIIEPQAEYGIEIDTPYDFKLAEYFISQREATQCR